MAPKKVKISSVKRAAHLKLKKTPLTKQQQHRIKQKQQQLSAAGKEIGHQNIFSQKAHKRDNLAQKKKRNKRFSLGLPMFDIHEDEQDEDDQLLANVADMLDGDDFALLNVKNKRKRKAQDIHLPEHDAVGLELAYASESKKENEAKKIKVNLLPIKSRDGEIITRTTEVDYVPKPKIFKTIEDVSVDDQEDYTDNSSYGDSDDDIINDASPNAAQSRKLISTTDLFITRQQEIERQKYRIGIICSGILEKPEDKMRNFKALFELIDETTPDGIPNLLTVRKVAIISVTEIFKDILPEYRVGQVDTKMQTLRKATLERVTYENALLRQFKKFLEKIEKLTAVINKRGTGKRTPQAIELAALAVQCMSELLIDHPYFNYVQNIAQLLVYMLNCNYATMRQMVNNCFRTLFANDKRLDMTLFIVRRINHLIKKKQNNVHVECLTCLMSLKIKNVNLDTEKQNELKQKKLESHRQRLINLSKKERKRRKKLTELNKELEETLAEENKQSKHRKLTEIIKMVFTIYFRVLKNDPTSGVLSAILEGLAEFAHVINLDFFADLIDVLNRILEGQDLGYREQLHCIQTIFVILSGQGEVLNIDPIRFYQHFYRNMLVVNGGKNHNDFDIILRTLDEVLVKRRRNMDQQRLMAFIKRLLTGSLHLLHHGTLATLGTVKTSFQLTSVLGALLDTDTSIGSGSYEAELDDPEYCIASSTALYELAILARHYHPIVRRMAGHIAHGVPATGEGTLPAEIGKLSAYELFTQYDSTQMAFNPTIPIPRQVDAKLKKGKHRYLSAEFKFYCSHLLNSWRCASTRSKNNLQFNFREALRRC